MNLLDDLTNKELIPVVEIGSDKTYNPQYVIPCESYVIKIGNLVNSTGMKFNKNYEMIRKVGGLHNFFPKGGKAILSSIMTDKKIAGFNREQFLSVIQATRPYSIITPDGETYRNELKRSNYVMEQSLDSIDYLLDHDVRPDQMIGLVLGANIRQIDEYILELKQRKIPKFCLHTGDFNFRRGAKSKQIAIDYARHIRSQVPYLMVYGGGCRTFFQRYDFAHAFVTQSHIVAGFKHKKICRHGQKRYDGELSRDLIMSNLYEIYHYHFNREDIMSLSNIFETSCVEVSNENASSPIGGV
ncbi:MAG: hypothetical protein ABFC71_02065 [Methanoregula sp.]